MRSLGRIDVVSGDATRSIELYEGDLSALPHDHKVDVLVVSAFSNNYLETSGSVIGALNRRGISVRDMATEKAMDLRSERSCWLSSPVADEPGFRHLLCFEPLRSNLAPEVVDDIFDSLDQLVLGEYRDASVAMPVVSTGDMGVPLESMFPALLDAAIERLRIGLPLRTLKIVEFDSHKAAQLEQMFADYVARKGTRIEARPRRTAIGPSPAFETLDATDGPVGWDCFVSYSRKDNALADTFVQLLEREFPKARIFRDSESIHQGVGWISTLADAIDSSRCFVAVLSPDYFDSKWCRREFDAAIIRSDQGDDELLYPIYWREDKDAPSLYLTFNYVNCIETDIGKLEAATKKLATRLQ